VCRRFVVGTELGHCPRCGWVPPVVAPAPPRAPRSRVVVLLVILALAIALAIAVFARGA
jgi:hypothetical protein